VSDQDPTLPLSGLNVLEIAHYIAGPYAAQILGDQGATVVKVEPPAGEPGRRALPVNPDGESLYYASYNRNKKNVSLDLRKPESRIVLDGLIKWADVVLTNYSPGVPEKLGFGWDQVHQLNPAAVMVFISGFGTYSSLSDYVAFDGIVTAMSGIADMTGDPDGPPYIGNVLLGDHTTALQAAMAATTALHLRQRTGEGSYVEVSMIRSLASLLGDHVPARATLGQEPRRRGNQSSLRFGNVFPTADGYVVISPITVTMWKTFCDVLGRPEWGTEQIVVERRHVKDKEFRAEIEQATRDWMSARTSQEALELMQGLGIPTGAVKSISQVCDDDERMDLRLFEDVELLGGGKARVLGRVFDWDGGDSEGTFTNRLSGLGADGASVLEGLGLSPDAIAALVEAGAVHGVRPPTMTGSGA